MSNDTPDKNLNAKPIEPTIGKVAPSTGPDQRKSDMTDKSPAKEQNPNGNQFSPDKKTEVRPPAGR